MGNIGNILALFGGGKFLYGLIGVVLLYVFKKIPNEWIQKYVSKLFYGFGVTVTCGFAKWTYTAALWNKTIEPYFVDLVDNTISCAIKAFIAGLRSDNL